jgi:tryptophan synthase alpha chain
MNRIDTLFSGKPSGILSVYYPAGYPKLEDTVPVLHELAGCGVDLVEIGMPFSDPVADGPVLEQAGQQAIKNGMSLTKLFEQLSGIREKIDIPLILMGYLNPVIKYGIGEFCRMARGRGIDGIILPDMPVEEYLRSFSPYFEENGLYNIFLVTPQTPPERIRLMDRMGKGFLYMVSVSSTTGERNGFDEEQLEYFRRIDKMGLRLPRLIGFGIADRATYAEACRYASGAIIGSAFVRNISDTGRFIRNITGS